MPFVTYENRNNPHITIHREGCSQPQKRGGEGRGEYKVHDTYQAARQYAQRTGLQIIDCSFCKPS